MHNIETHIRELISKVALDSSTKGYITCELNDGSAGYSGSLLTSNSSTHQQSIDITSIFDDLRRKNDLKFDELLFSLREASKAYPHGPIYHCEIEINGYNVSFNYFWENESFDTLDQIKRTNANTLPTFIYEKIFNEELVSFIGDYEIDAAIGFHVSSQYCKEKNINNSLLEMYALIDWQWDTENGGLDQYFARNMDYFDCYPRENLYPFVLKALETLNYYEATELFKECIALYSHFYDRVDNARKIMGIPSIEKQTESDINQRYYTVYEILASYRHNHIRENIKRYAQ